MPRPSSDYPTELELAILKILWESSPLPVRDVRDRLADGQDGRDLTHSSVITILNIMVKKGYLRREKEGKALLFEPIVAEQDVHQGMVGDILQRVFDGSASSMMLSLLETADMDFEELKELRKLINKKAKEQRDG